MKSNYQGAGAPSPRATSPWGRGRPCSLVRLLAFVGVVATTHGQEAATPSPSLIVVAGAGGGSDYDAAFAKWLENWRQAGVKGGARVTTIGLPSAEEECLTPLRSALQQESATGEQPLWLVLLGHGTTDGREPKFNLRGADLTAAELAEWLKPMQRPVVIVAAFSASGAFLTPLSVPGRIVLTATKSGSENNYARLGRYLSEAIADETADLDHDGQTSLLEAWLRAAQETADFYQSEGRIATEHSILDDNGDSRGTPADWFAGLRVVKKASTGGLPDGLRAHQMHLVPGTAERELSPAVRRERDALEMEIARLREAKSTLTEGEYFAQLEAAMLRLARVYRDAKTPRAD